MNRDHLQWPFFSDAHRDLARGLAAWSSGLPALCGDHAEDDVDGTCRRLVQGLGTAGWLRFFVPAAHGGSVPALYSRALCGARGTLAYHERPGDFSFAVAGLGSR